MASSVAGEMRPQRLGDGECEQLLVPHQEDLVAVAAAERSQHLAPRRDLVALLEAP